MCSFVTACGCTYYDVSTRGHLSLFYLWQLRGKVCESIYSHSDSSLFSLLAASVSKGPWLILSRQAKFIQYMGRMENGNVVTVSEDMDLRTLSDVMKKMKMYVTQERTVTRVASLMLWDYLSFTWVTLDMITTLEEVYRQTRAPMPLKVSPNTFPTMRVAITVL